MFALIPTVYKEKAEYPGTEGTHWKWTPRKAGFLKERIELSSLSFCGFHQMISGILTLLGLPWETFHKLETWDKFPGH